MQTTGGAKGMVQKLGGIKKHPTGIDKHKSIEKHGSIKKHSMGLSSWHEGKK